MERTTEYVFVQTDFAKSYREALKKEFEWSTFPMIVKVTDDGEDFIGGYEDLCYVLEKDSKAPT
jgi:glutaredoxin-related protein